MTIVRVRKKRNPYVQIDKTPLLDKRLSWKARGLMSFLLTKPDDWSVQVNDLVKQSDRDGRESVQGGLKELTELGYVVKQKTKDEKGRFSGWETIVFETLEDRQSWDEGHSAEERVSRMSDKPKADKPKADKPESGKTESGEPVPLLINEDQLINEFLVINDLTHTERSFSQNASLSEPEPSAPELPVPSSPPKDTEAPSSTGNETKIAAISPKKEKALTESQKLDQATARYAYPECKWKEIWQLYCLDLSHLWVGKSADVNDRQSWHPALIAGVTAYKAKLEQLTDLEAVKTYIRRRLEKGDDLDLQSRFAEGQAILARKQATPIALDYTPPPPPLPMTPAEIKERNAAIARGVAAAKLKPKEMNHAIT